MLHALINDYCIFPCCVLCYLCLLFKAQNRLFFFLLFLLLFFHYSLSYALKYRQKERFCKMIMTDKLKIQLSRVAKNEKKKNRRRNEKNKITICIFVLSIICQKPQARNMCTGLHQQ